LGLVGERIKTLRRSMWRGGKVLPGRSPPQKEGRQTGDTHKKSLILSQELREGNSTSSKKGGGEDAKRKLPDARKRGRRKFVQNATICRGEPTLGGRGEKENHGPDPGEWTGGGFGRET